MRNCSVSAMVLAAVLGLGTVGAAAQEIVIGAVYPLTGGVSYDGQTDLNGAKTALDEINAAGGVLGRKLKLVAEDGACNPSQSVAGAEKLISQQKVVALLGALCSSATGAVSETVRKYKIPLMSGVSTAERLTEEGNPWFFRATTTTKLNGASLAKPLLDMAGGAKKIALIVTSDDWGRSAVTAYGNAFKALGASIVATEYFDRNDTDFTEHLTKIRAAAPDVIFSVGGFQNAANVTIQARQLGITVPILGEGAFCSDPWAKLVGGFTGNTIGILEWVTGIDDEVNKRFIENYRKAFNELPTKFSAAGYNTMHILAEAIRRAGSTEPDALRKALAETDYTGIMGRYRFDAKGQAYDFNVFLVEWKDGKSVVKRTAQIAKQ
jgi:branched-chain amino acid transport system substrate-binding protein